jgi:predicted metal-dependent peptidase
MKNNPIELIQQAKRILIRDHPELAWVLFQFKITIDEKMPYTAQVNILKKEILLNPIAIENFQNFLGISNFSLLYMYEYFIWHEVKHVLLKHFERGWMIKAEPTLWNLACDLIIEYTNMKEGLHNSINSTIIKLANHYKLLQPPITAEHIYYILKSKKEIIIARIISINDNIIYGQSQDLDSIISTTLHSYLKSIGQETGKWLDEYDIVLTKLNIIKYIQNIVALSLLRAEPNIKIPHRRQIALNLNILWEQIKLTRQKKGLVAIDTSGSITKDEFAIFMSGVLNATKEISVDLILWDTKIQDEFQDVKDIEILIQKIKFKGRGGTNLNCVMDYLSQRNYKHCIILTDGYCDFDMEKWYNLKQKPQVVVFYTEDVIFDYPDSWDMHFLDVKKLMMEAIKIKGGLS